MLEERQVQVLVEHLPAAGLFFRNGGDDSQLFILFGLAGWWPQWPHEGASYTAVQQQATQDKEATSPPKIIEEVLVGRSQGAEEDRAACHCQPISNGALFIKIFANHSQCWLQVEGQSKPCDDRSLLALKRQYNNY